MAYVLALDQGTTSSRAVIYDAQGRSVCMAQRPLRQVFPQPGWVEHDPLEIWNAQRAVATEAIDRMGSRKGLRSNGFGISALGIANQRESVVLWERATGRPVYNAIVWQDRRTADLCARMASGPSAAKITRKTGLVVDAYFSATKIQWLLEHVPGARQRAQRGELACGTIDTWLLWNLTGGRVHATDPGNASRTMLFNIHTLEWDVELLELFAIPRSLLPAIVPSMGVMGESDPSVLGVSLPIAGLAGDQQAALFGQVCFEPGMAKSTYGTGGFMLMNTGTRPVRSAHRLLGTVAWQGPQVPHRTAYGLEGSVFMAGAIVQWLRDGLGIIDSAAEVQTRARQVKDTGDVYLVPAFTGLGAPYWDGHARGTLVGMTRGTTRAHIARAALEAIALQSAEVFGAMEKDSGIALTQLRVDGGACANDLLMQLQADYLGVPVERPKVTETTALGAAYLAGLATGVWKDAGQLTAQWRLDRRFEPRMSPQERGEKQARWRQAVERASKWAHTA